VTGSLAFLQDNERLALAEYADRLLSTAGFQVQNVILFGSKARGDLGPDSDLDVLIEPEGENRVHAACSW
jgi:predicted nucleotidyltransferase